MTCISLVVFYAAYDYSIKGGKRQAESAFWKKRFARQLKIGKILYKIGKMNAID